LQCVSLIRKIIEALFGAILEGFAGEMLGSLICMISGIVRVFLRGGGPFCVILGGLACVNSEWLGGFGGLGPGP